MVKWRYPLESPFSCHQVPTGEHPGAFGVRRKHHIHEGVDLYCAQGTPVYAVEDGLAVLTTQFTGPQLGHTWWTTTFAVMVRGKSGLVVYGEIRPDPAFALCSTGKHVRGVRRGDLIGLVIPVLDRRPDKPNRPTSMLHIELRAPGHTEHFDWQLDAPKPDWLLDPTPYLLDAT